MITYSVPETAIILCIMIILSSGVAYIANKVKQPVITLIVLIGFGLHAFLPKQSFQIETLLSLFGVFSLVAIGLELFFGLRQAIHRESSLIKALLSILFLLILIALVLKETITS